MQLTKNQKYLLIIFFVAIMVRIYLLATIQILPLYYDAQYYYILGERIANNSIIEYMKHPAPDCGPTYPIFLGILFRLLGVGQIQIYIVQMFLDLISIFLIYKLGKMIADEKVGVLAAGIYSFHPSPLIYFRCVLTESLMLFLIILFFALLFWSIEKRKTLLFFITGLVGILCGLTRLIFMGFPFICAVWLFFYFWNEKKQALKFTFSFLIPYLFIGGFTVLTFGRYAQKIAISLFKKNVHLGLRQIYENVSMLWSEIQVRQAVFMENEKYVFRYSILPTILTFPIYTFIIYCSLFSVFFVRMNKKNLLLYLFLLYWTFGHTFTLSIPRYQVSSAPIITLIFSIFVFRYIEIRKKCN